MNVLKITSNTTWEDLQALIGKSILQISTPSSKYNGFELHNFNGVLESLHLDEGKPGLVGLKVFEKDILWVRKAVVTSQSTALEAIRDFERSG